MELENAMAVAASGMRAQGVRLRMIAENVANAGSTADRTGGDPYRRKILTFENVLDRELGVNLVEAGKVTEDMSDFALVYDPNHPAANEDGYYEQPNVTTLIEMMDMREAQRSYEANLQMVSASRRMMSQTVDLLR